LCAAFRRLALILSFSREEKGHPPTACEYRGLFLTNERRYVPYRLPTTDYRLPSTVYRLPTAVYPRHLPRQPAGLVLDLIVQAVLEALQRRSSHDVGRRGGNRCHE